MGKAKVCAVSGQQFSITDEDLRFYEKMGVPEPTLCPQERDARDSWLLCDSSQVRSHLYVRFTVGVAAFHLDLHCDLANFFC